jgi:hypothetical protein
LLWIKALRLLIRRPAPTRRITEKKTAETTRKLRVKAVAAD